MGKTYRRNGDNKWRGPKKPIKGYSKDEGDLDFNVKNPKKNIDWEQFNNKPKGKPNDAK